VGCSLGTLSKGNWFKSKKCLKLHSNGIWNKLNFLLFTFYFNSYFDYRKFLRHVKIFHLIKSKPLIFVILNYHKILNIFFQHHCIVLWNKSLEWVLIAFVRKKLFSILQHHQKTRKKHIFIWSIIKNFFYWKIVLHTMKRPDEWNFSFISSSKVNYFSAQRMGMNDFSVKFVSLSLPNCHFTYKTRQP